MGTNYYYDDGRHIAKTSAIGYGRFQVFWAIDPHDLERLPIVDEYGHPWTHREFLAKVARATVQDFSNVGQEFS